MRSLGWLWIVCVAGCYPSLDDAPFLTRDAGSDTDTSDAPAPDVPTPGTTVHVDETAAAGGNGAESRPFKTVSEALATDALGITVAAGEYEVPTEWASLGRRRIVGVGPRTVFTAAGPVRWTVPRGLELAAHQWSAHLRVEGDLIADDVRWELGLEVEGAASTTLDGCSAMGGGVRVAGALQFAATDLSIEQTTGGALWLQVGSARIVTLTVDRVTATEDDEGDGVTLVGGEVTITGGNVNRVAGRGLTASGSTVTLTAFHVADAGAGIWIAGPGARIDASTVTDTRRTGILLVGSPDRGSFVVGNTVVRDATLAGLQLRNADAEVTQSEFSGTIRAVEEGVETENANGISVLDSHLEATMCLLENNQTNGIYIEHPSSAALRANTYRDNGTWGVLAVCGENGAQPEITDMGSTYSGNGAGDEASVLCQ